MGSARETHLQVGGGRLHAIEWGPASGRLVLLLPGLTANARGFDLICARLADAGLRAVAFDLRGRGRSDVTPAGTYGWEGHARDLIDAAKALCAGRVHPVGWSMGAFVAMQAAACLAPGRIGRMVLIDACGRPPAAAMPLIQRSVDRLGASYPSATEYLARLRALGTIAPWHPSRSCLHAGLVSMLHRFRHVTAARLLAPWAVPFATAGTLSSELSSRRSPDLNVRFATRLSGCYRDRSLLGWFEIVAGCTNNVEQVGCNGCLVGRSGLEPSHECGDRGTLTTTVSSEPHNE